MIRQSIALLGAAAFVLGTTQISYAQENRAQTWENQSSTVDKVAQQHLSLIHI